MVRVGEAASDDIARAMLTGVFYIIKGAPPGRKIIIEKEPTP
jgi:hypothetical protein